MAALYRWPLYVLASECFCSYSENIIYHKLSIDTAQ